MKMGLRPPRNANPTINVTVPPAERNLILKTQILGFI
jgi:hypothetical protein